MRSAVKSAMRTVIMRKVETLALVALVFIAVLGLASTAIVKENLERSVYETIRVFSGDVLVQGVFERRHVEMLEREGMNVSARRALLGFAAAEGRAPVVFLDRSSARQMFGIVAIEGEMPSDRGEALLYSSVRAPVEARAVAKIGDSLQVFMLNLSSGRPYISSLKVVGVAKGLNHIGPTGQIIVIDDGLMESLTGGKYTLLAIYVGGDVSRGEKIVEMLRADGAEVSWYFINSAEENPILIILEGVLGLFALPLLMLFLSAPLMTLAAGSAMVARDFKLVGIMKAMGMGRKELLVHYSLPWIIRALIGAVLAAAVAPYASERLYLASFGDSEIARTIYEALGFEASPATIARSAVAVLALTIASSLVIFLIADRIEARSAISQLGLYATRPPSALSALRGPLWLRYAVRDLAARPWKPAAIGALISVILGLYMASVAIDIGASEAAEMAMRGELSPAETYARVQLAERMPVDMLGASVGSLLRQAGARYHLSLISSMPKAVEGVGFVYAVRSLDGDPSFEFPLTRGRLPQKGGEVVISESLSALLGADVNDTITVRSGSRSAELTVVGISRAIHHSGSYILMTEESYEKITGIAVREVQSFYVASSLGARELEEALSSLTAYLDIEGREELARTVRASSLLARGAMLTTSIVAIVSAAITLAAVIASDTAVRSREMAVMKALGTPSARLAASGAAETLISVALFLPLSFLIAQIAADRMARGAATFLPYVEPSVSLAVLADPGILALMALAAAFAAGLSLLHYRQLNVTRALSEI